MDKSSRRCAQMGTKIWTVAQTAVTEEKTVPQTAVTPTTFDWGNPV